MSDIFISYAKADEARARRLADALQAHGYKVWWDKKIPIGKTWRQFIAQSLADARCVVVLWSHKSIASGFVLEEASYAKENDKLVPVFIDDVQSPFGFREIEGAQLAGWNGDPSNEEYRELLVSLAGMLGRAVPAQQPPTSRRARRTWLWIAAAIAIVAATAAALWVQTGRVEHRAMLPKGSLSIDVSPWAEIKSIRSASGQVVEPELFEGEFKDDTRVTPCFIRLPVGEYTIEFANPSFPETLVRNVTVSADANTTVRGVIPGFRHEDLVPSF